MESLPIIIAADGSQIDTNESWLYMDVNCRFSRLSPICATWSGYSKCSLVHGGKCINKNHLRINRVHGIKIAPPNSIRDVVYILHSRMDGRFVVTILGTEPFSHSQCYVETVPHTVAKGYCDVTTNDCVELGNYPYGGKRFIVNGVFVNAMHSPSLTRYTVVMCYTMNPDEHRVFAYDQRPFGYDFIICTSMLQGPSDLRYEPVDWNRKYICARDLVSFNKYKNYRNDDSVYMIYCQSPLDGHYDVFEVTFYQYNLTEYADVSIVNLAAYGGNVLSTNTSYDSERVYYTHNIDSRAHYSLENKACGSHYLYVGIKYRTNGSVYAILTLLQDGSGTPVNTCFDTPYHGILAKPGELYKFVRFSQSKRESYIYERLYVRHENDRWKEVDGCELAGRLLYASHTPDDNIFAPIMNIISEMGGTDTIDEVFIAFDMAIITADVALAGGDNKYKKITKILTCRHQPLQRSRDVDTWFDILPRDIIEMINDWLFGDDQIWSIMHKIEHHTKIVHYIKEKRRYAILGR